MRGDASSESVDRLVATISDHRRRRLLTYMHAADRDVFTVDDLAESLLERDAGLADAAATDRERVTIDLHHRHLPKMDDAGLIEYDARNGELRFRAAVDGDVSRLVDELGSMRPAPDAPDSR